MIVVFTISVCLDAATGDDACTIKKTTADIVVYELTWQGCVYACSMYILSICHM